MNTKSFRELTSQEVDQLQRLGNRAEDWQAVRVSGAFDANLVHNNVFIGQVCLGAVAPGYLHDGEEHSFLERYKEND